MKLPIAYFGHPILRKKAAPVEQIDECLKKLVQDMEETMHAHEGCGLAAPQVHHSLSLFITSIPKESEEGQVSEGELRVFINPKILSYSKESWSCQEGCLSIPGLRADVERPLEVEIEATNLRGERFREKFSHFEAHVILHENDHLNGVLYIDRLAPKRKKEIEPKLRAIKKKQF